MIVISDWWKANQLDAFPLEPFNALTLQRIPSHEPEPTDQIPILHRDRGAQRAGANSSLLQQSAKRRENGLDDREMLRRRSGSRHSSQPAKCRRSRPLVAQASTPGNRRSAG